MADNPMVQNYSLEAYEKIVKLERALKWWSECTALWREKWGEMKNERDKLFQDFHVLKGQNYALINQYDALKNENDKLKREIDSFHGKRQVARVEPMISTFSNIVQFSNQVEIAEGQHQNAEMTKKLAKPKLSTLESKTNQINANATNNFTNDEQESDGINFSGNQNLISELKQKLNTLIENFVRLEELSFHNETSNNREDINQKILIDQLCFVLGEMKTSFAILRNFVSENR